MGRAMHGRRIDNWQMDARLRAVLTEPRVWKREPYQYADCGFDLAHDRSDDDEGGFRFGAECWTEAERVVDHVVCKLGGEAVLDGVSGLVVLSESLFHMDYAVGGRSIHRRLYHPGSCALYGDGLRLELPDRWRPGLYPRASVSE